jgi:phage terminase small subunit
MNKRKNPVTGLTEKQGRFFREYLVDWNGKRSAVCAGYPPRGAVAACRTLTNAIKYFGRGA